MNFHAIPNFLGAVLIFAIGVFSILKNRESKINFSFFLLTFGAFIWQLCTGLAISAKSPFSALIATRIAFFGIALIPVFSYQLSLYISGRHANKILNAGYILALLFFIPLSWTPLILNGVYSYNWGYFFKAGRLHPVFMVFFIYFMGLIFSNLFLSFRKETVPIEKNRKKYFLISLFIAYIGSVDYLPTYGVKVYPLGYLTLICFVLIFAYAILRFQIMDINIALTRAGIFAAVYALVLGLPFWLGYTTKTWLPATTLAVTLATLGPFIYTYLRRRAEDVILKDQRRYQEVMRQLSSTITLIKDLDRLLKLVVLRVARAVRVDFACIYLAEENSHRLVLKNP
jgi:MFS family permease